MNEHQNAPASENEAACLEQLVGQLHALQLKVMEEMRREYPEGSRVVFWRSSNQRRESFGTVIGHSMSHGPELRVRYDKSDHVVGLHVGHTKFHSLPNTEVSRGT